MFTAVQFTGTQAKEWLNVNSYFHINTGKKKAVYRQHFSEVNFTPLEIFIYFLSSFSLFPHRSIIIILPLLTLLSDPLLLFLALITKESFAHWARS